MSGTLPINLSEIGRYLDERRLDEHLLGGVVERESRLRKIRSLMLTLNESQFQAVYDGLMALIAQHGHKEPEESDAAKNSKRRRAAELYGSRDNPELMARSTSANYTVDPI